MAFWTAIDDAVTGIGFSYDFPIEWDSDGNVGGWDAAAAVAGNWVARTEEAELLEPVLFANQGTGAISTYVVSFGTILYEVSEAQGSGIPGWDMGGGYYVGVWDGLLQVTTTAIAGALSPPESGVSLNGILLEYTPPSSVTGLWTAVSKEAA